MSGKTVNSAILLLIIGNAMALISDVLIKTLGSDAHSRDAVCSGIFRRAPEQLEPAGGGKRLRRYHRHTAAGGYRLGCDSCPGIRLYW